MMFSIQSLYSQKEFFKQAQEFFNQEGFIQLQHFFEESNELNTFQSQIFKLNEFSTSYNPSIESKEIISIKSVPPRLLPQIEYFKSKTLEQYIEQLTSFSLSLHSFEISKFSHKSFELLHDSKIADSLLIDVYYFLTNDEFNSQFGGDKIYTTHSEELFYITPQNNTLTCVFRDDEMRVYTKYINSLAKDKKYIQIKSTFEIVGSIEEDIM